MHELILVKNFLKIFVTESKILQIFFYILFIIQYVHERYYIQTFFVFKTYNRAIQTT